jgi:lipopolysaccharide export system protein LptA
MQLSHAPRSRGRDPYKGRPNEFSLLPHTCQRPSDRELASTVQQGENGATLAVDYGQVGSDRASWLSAKRIISVWRSLMKTRLLAVAIILLTASVLAAQTPQASSLGIESSKQQSVTASGGNGPMFLRGNVELTIGSVTVSADEVEVRQTPPEAVLRGTVTIRPIPLPWVKANSLMRTGKGLVRCRGNVEVSLGTSGVTILADEADATAENQFTLRGNVVLKKTTPKK